jgi:hypothetical protein
MFMVVKVFLRSIAVFAVATGFYWVIGEYLIWLHNF